MSSPPIQPQPHPLPLDLRKTLPDPMVPLRISDRLFGAMKTDPPCPYKKVQVLPTDPEWRFVWRYFYHDAPHVYSMKRIYCLHERHQQQMFEVNFSSLEREAESCKPTWDQEPLAAQRAQAIERWRGASGLFSPFQSMESDGRRRNWSKTKLLPLWHGSTAPVCDAIASSGFLYFGKTSLGGKTSTAASTDDGFFGSGIYFTNSARYAADIYSSGHLLLAWVSMREPFPVVGDADQTDMKVLGGKGAYKNYNAHYIPVVSIDPLNPYEGFYYPAQAGESPHCDEVVVFHKSQTLPRFWVELEVSVPYLMDPSHIPHFVQELIPHLMHRLEHAEIDQDPKLRRYLGEELAFLLKLNEDDDLEDYGDKYPKLYEQLTQLIDTAGKVNREVRRLLMESQATIPGSFSASLPSSSSPSPSALSSAVSPSGGGSSSSAPSPSSPPSVAASSTSHGLTTPLSPSSSISGSSSSVASLSSTLHPLGIPPPSVAHDSGSPALSPSLTPAPSSSASPSSTTPLDGSPPSIMTVPAMAFGKAQWERYFGDVGAEPPLPKDIAALLRSPCPYWEGKRVEETHLLVLIPKTVNGIPFTLGTLGEMIKSPRGGGHPTKYYNYDNLTLKELKDRGISSSYWVLMTKDVLPGSRNELYAMQQRLLKSPYAAPYALEAATGILTHHVRSGERLYSDNPWTYTYCQEVLSKGWRVVVGAFGSSDLHLIYRGYCSDYYGLGGVRKF